MGFFNIHSVAKLQKIEGGIFIFGKQISKCRKKLKGETLWDFPTSILTQNSKNIEGGPFGEKIPEKKSQCRKKLKGDSLVPPGIVCYAEKQEEPFWFSSLGQMVQFGAIIFCRTFRNYFGQFVWIKKVTIIVAFHFMKRRLQIEYHFFSKSAEKALRSLNAFFTQKKFMKVKRVPFDKRKNFGEKSHRAEKTQTFGLPSTFASIEIFGLERHFIHVHLLLRPQKNPDYHLGQVAVRSYCIKYF